MDQQREDEARRVLQARRETDPELAALYSIVSQLNELADDARRRLLAYCVDRYTTTP